MANNILTDTIRRDGEYSQLIETLRREFRISKPHHTLVNGLCEGAADALLVSTLEDLQDEQPAGCNGSGSHG
jgi:hypothetical protein